MKLEFRLLGDVAVLADGQPLDLGGTRQRSVFALLVLQRGRPLSTELLASRLWPDEQPLSALKTVQVYISRIRRALGPNADRLTSSSTGYRLAITDDELDIARFEQGVRSAREALASGSLDAASGTLEETLALWSGPALADLAGEQFARREADRLEELRVQALEELFDLRIGAGMGRETIAGLRGLLEDQPGRERLWRMLMLALYSDGRQGEALQAYQDARRYLADELGLDPSPDLVELERAILTQRAGTAIPRPPDTLMGSPDLGLGNLPSDPSRFIGRDQDLARVEALLEQGRLITLLGPGGIGKTRLAIQAAVHQTDRFPDGVWMVELAPISQAELVVSEIADIWGLRPGEGSLDDVVVNYLSSKRLLLVVDNCEHVRDVVARLLLRVLRKAPEVSLVTTSRESLGVPGEIGYRVPTLGIPNDKEDAVGSDAVRLFIDRVPDEQRDLVRSATEMDAIVRICRRLDGMPLGLELAAARLRTLSPAELADRLDTSFGILTGGSKTAIPRQRTLQATIDWSYELLTPAERSVFRRLSVFAGGFDLAAAEAVGSGGLVDDRDSLRHLDSLVDKSLVVVTHGPRSRFRLLEPIRQYAEEALIAAREAEETKLAHARHYAEVAREAEPHIRGHRQLEWSGRLDADHDNLRAALATLRDADDSDDYLDMCFDLFFYWEHDGMQHEGIDYIVAGLSAPAGPDPRRAARAWYEAALLGLDISDPRAVEHAERGLAFARALADPGLIGRLELCLGAAIKNTTGRTDGDAYVLDGEALWLRHLEPGFWDLDWEVSQLSLLRGVFLPEGHPERRQHLEEAIAGFRSCGDYAMLSLTLIVTNFLAGSVDDDWIFGNLVEAIRISRSSGYRQTLGHGLYYWGAMLRRRGEGEAGRTALDEAAKILEEIGDVACSHGASLQAIAVDAVTNRRDEARVRLGDEARTLAGHAEPAWGVRVIDCACLLALESADYEAAARFLGRCERSPLQRARIAEIPFYRARLEVELDPRDLERRVAEGAAMTFDEALASVAAWAAKAP